MDWSTDGQSILFADGDIFVASSDGTNVRNLTQDAAGYLYPTWSPNGHLIAFIRRDGTLNSLYIMNNDGAEINKVADLAIRNSYSMFNYTSLPNSKYILYDNKLIDIDTGVISELSFPFDPSSAVWFMKTQGSGIVPIPQPHQ